MPDAPTPGEEEAPDDLDLDFLRAVAMSPALCENDPDAVLDYLTQAVDAVASLRTQLAEARAEIEYRKAIEADLRPVVEAAEAWRDGEGGTDLLVAAVDTYQKDKAAE